MKVKEIASKKRKPKNKSKLTEEKAVIENKMRKEFDVYRLLDNKEFLRALKEKLATI